MLDTKKPNFPVVHLDDPLIQKYLEARKELLDKVRPYVRFTEVLDEYAIDGKIDSILQQYDRKALLPKNLSKKASSLLLGYDPLIEIVEYKYLEHYYRVPTKSFETKKDRENWEKIYVADARAEWAEEDDDPLEDYEHVDLVEVKGTLDDHYDKIIKGNEDGKDWFILASSIYSENIVLGHTIY